MSNPIITFIALVFVAMIFIIGAYIYTLAYNVIPYSPLGNTLMVNVYQSIFGFFNASFIVFLFVLLFIDLAIAYFRPSIIDGFFNLFLLFMFGYIMLQFQNFISLLNIFNFKALLPSIYTILNSNYLTLLILGFLIGSIILNFRKRDNYE